MNLLLLLSALLSALTGVGASTRVPERAQAVAAVSIGRAAVVAAPARAALRPATALPRPEEIATLGVVTTPAFRATPAWTDRRRE